MLELRGRLALALRKLIQIEERELVEIVNQARKSSQQWKKIVTTDIGAMAAKESMAGWTIIVGKRAKHVADLKRQLQEALNGVSHGNDMQDTGTGCSGPYLPGKVPLGPAKSYELCAGS